MVPHRDYFRGQGVTGRKTSATGNIKSQKRVNIIIQSTISIYVIDLALLVLCIVSFLLRVFRMALRVLKLNQTTLMSDVIPSLICERCCMLGNPKDHKKGREGLL